MCKFHDDVIKWKHFPRYWPFVRGIHRSPVNSPHKGQWRGALMFSLTCAWINGWINNRAAGDLRRHYVHYDVNVIFMGYILHQLCPIDYLERNKINRVFISASNESSPDIFLFVLSWKKIEWNVNQNDCHTRMSAKWRSFRLGLNVATKWPYPNHPISSKRLFLMLHIFHDQWHHQPCQCIEQDYSILAIYLWFRLYYIRILYSIHSYFYTHCDKKNYSYLKLHLMFSKCRVWCKVLCFNNNAMSNIKPHCCYLGDLQWGCRLVAWKNV